jgi:hypothetical protein
MAQMGKHKLVGVRRILEEMWSRRASRLLRTVGERTRGRVPGFSRDFIQAKIVEIQDLAGEFLIPSLRRRIAHEAHQRRVRFPNRVRRTEKWNVLRTVLARGRHVSAKHFVYVIWGRDRRCLKVGRSDTGLNRLYGQRDASYFRDSQRITLYFPVSAKRLPALECRLTHLFRPDLYRVKPAQRKYRTKCEVCQLQRRVKREVESMFPLKHKRR